MSLTKREIIIIGFFVLLVFVIAGSKLLLNSSNKPVLEIQHQENVENEVSGSPQKDQNEDIEIKSPGMIVVDICGEVRYPGVVSLEEGSRIIDAVESVGGLLESADRRQVNMARRLSDGEQIYIPKVGEANIAVSSNVLNLNNNQNTSLGKVNINTATLSELESLDGIGEVIAERILQYREQNGNFSDINDLKQVTGIGDKKFESIKESICVN